MRTFVIPGLGLQPGAHHRTGLVARVGGLPRGLEHRQVARDLAGALAHRRVEWLQLRDLAGHGIERQGVCVQRRGEARVGCEDRGAERADSALLPEQRGRVEPAPCTRGPHTRPNLQVDVTVRIARPRGPVRDGDRLQALDRHGLLPPARADAGDRVQAEPGPDLSHGVPLRSIQRLGHVRVQGSGDRQGLGGVHDHLGEPRRALSSLARLTRSPHRLPGDRVDPVDPAGVLDGRQSSLAGDLPGPVDDRQVGPCDAAFQVVLVSP